LTKLYPILDTSALEQRNCSLGMAAKAMLDSGAKLLQIRHKAFWSRDTYSLAESVADQCRQHGVTLVINDRADFAMLLGSGLHVGQDDLPPSDARRLIGPSSTLGLSTHNAEQLADAAAEPADYVALGPIFGTANKDNPDPVVGLDQLAAWRTLVPQPLVAIGGITRHNAKAVLAAGADSVAVIGDLLPEPCNEFTLRERMEEWQRLLNL
jgi:thiamine-phosphate pyrophosphorylase